MTNITQLINSKGNAVANHFVITDQHGQTLQSYRSKVAHKDHSGSISLGEDWDYSATTLKHVKQFLNVSFSKKDIQGMIDSGQIKVVDLK